MQQRKITKRAPLLNEQGHLTCPGWATDLVYAYDPKAVRANPIRIKEWDYYIILSDSGNTPCRCALPTTAIWGL